MANILLHSHLSCYSLTFTLVLTFQKYFFFLWEKSIIGNTIYLINFMASFNIDFVCYHKWILAKFFIRSPPLSLQEVP